MALEHLQTLDQAQRRRRPTARPLPSPIERKEKKRARDVADDELRDAVWARDGERSRASWRLLYRQHVDPDRRGEVAHLKPKSTYPSLRHALRNVVLLSATEHKLSDPRHAGAGGKALLEITGTNANKKLVFTMRDRRGHALWVRESWPPGGER